MDEKIIGEIIFLYCSRGRIVEGTNSSFPLSPPPPQQQKQKPQTIKANLE